MVVIPSPCFLDNLLVELAKDGALNGVFERIELVFNKNTYISPSAMVFLAVWGENRARSGNIISIAGERSVMDYLSRMNLFNAMNYEYEEFFHRRVSGGRFVPLIRVESSESVESAYERVCDLILCQFDNARDFLPAVDWAVYELLDNIIAHSYSDGCAYLFAQHILRKNKLCISIYDGGVGLLNSLRGHYEISNYEEAINCAMMRGCTSRKGEHLGNGLAGTREICNVNGGRFCIFTGSTHFVDPSTKEPFYKSIEKIEGTGVLLDLCTDKTVDLKDTFIEENEVDYIYRKVSRIENGGGLLLIDECPEFGSRESAKRLRRKIESIIPSMEVPLVLNFESVTSFSSSFADEFIAKLYAKLGTRFDSKIRIANIRDDLSRRIDVVINDRMTTLVD